MEKTGKITEVPHEELLSAKSGESFSRSAVLTDLLRFKDIFVHHEILAPGKRASSPHRHSHQEEMIFVLQGNPTAHIGEKSIALSVGDFIGFTPSANDLHFVENTTLSEARFLVITPKSENDRVSYERAPTGTPSFRLDINDSYFISNITPVDKPAYIEHLKEKQIYDQTLAIPFPYTEADADWWINNVADTTIKQGRSVIWAIRRTDGYLVGGIGFHDFQLAKSHKAEIGYWLAKPFWGQGIMTEAVKKVTEFGFKEFGLSRITANVFLFNKGSARVLEKAGYSLEGVMRSHYKKDDKIFDGKLYAMVTEEKR